MEDEVNSIDWEERLAGIQSFGNLDTRSPSCDVAWAEKLTASHSEDLLEEERIGRAEHVDTCSACSAALAQYQKIDELLGNLSSQELHANELEFGLPSVILEEWKTEDDGGASKQRRIVMYIMEAADSALCTLCKWRASASRAWPIVLAMLCWVVIIGFGFSTIFGVTESREHLWVALALCSVLLLLVFSPSPSIWLGKVRLQRRQDKNKWDRHSRYHDRH